MDELVLKLLSDDQLKTYWFPRYAVGPKNGAEERAKMPRSFQVGELKTGFIFWLVGCCLGSIALLGERIANCIQNVCFRQLVSFSNW